jgi:hypothetical protein
MDLSLPCWRHHLKVIGSRSATGSRRLGGMALWSAEAVAAAPYGSGLLSWRPRSPLQRRSYGTGRGLVRFRWRRGVVQAANLSTRLVRLWVTQSLIWLLRRLDSAG